VKSYHYGFDVRESMVSKDLKWVAEESMVLRAIMRWQLVKAAE
jgi:hypothetical protein